MKFDCNIKKSIKFLFCLGIFLSTFLYQNNSKIVNSLPMHDFKDGLVIEELRLTVPSEFKEVWLEAEKTIWDPWLSNQDGFLGRQLFWDKEKEEALILVSWQNKKLWKNIPLEEVTQVQEKFEQNVITSLNVKENPFQLVYEGELDKQV